MSSIILDATSATTGLSQVWGIIVSAGVSAAVALTVAKWSRNAQDRTFQTQRNDELREKLVPLTGLLQDGLFHASIEREDPVEMYRAIKRLRNQLTGARLVRDSVAAQAFEHIWDALYRKETEVDAVFPEVRVLAQKIGDGEVDPEKVRPQMILTYGSAITLMMRLRDEVIPERAILERRLKDLA